MVGIAEIRDKYGNEMAAIILSCRVHFGTAVLTDLQAFVDQNDIDWDKFSFLSRKHRIRPVVYKAMLAIKLQPDVTSFLFNSQALFIKRNWKQTIETEHIISLLNANGIEVVPYKGAAFSRQFFGDITSRESSDIDMVINPADLPIAITVLKRDGYLPEMDDVYNYLGSKYYTYYKDYSLNKFDSGKREFHVELHWAIAEKYIGLDARINNFLFDANSQIQLGKIPVKALADVAHFSAVVIHHSVVDTFGNLKNVVDISQAIKHHTIRQNNGVIDQNFAALHLRKALRLSNTLSQCLMGVSLPDTAILKEGDALLRIFINQLCGDTVLPAEHKKTAILTWVKNRARLQDSFARRLRFYLISFKYRFIPNEVDFKKMQLPHSLFFIYYILKPFRSVIKPFDIEEKKKKLIPVNS